MLFVTDWPKPCYTLLMPGEGVDGECSEYHEEDNAGAFQLKPLLQLSPPLLRWAGVTRRVSWLGSVLEHSLGAACQL